MHIGTFFCFVLFIFVYVRTHYLNVNQIIIFIWQFSHFDHCHFDYVFTISSHSKLSNAKANPHTVCPLCENAYFFPTQHICFTVKLRLKQIENKNKIITCKYSTFTHTQEDDNKKETQKKLSTFDCCYFSYHF